MASILMFLFSLFSYSGEDFSDHTLHVRQLWQHISGRQLAGRLTSLSFRHSESSKCPSPYCATSKSHFAQSSQNTMGRVQPFSCEDNSFKLIINVQHYCNVVWLLIHINAFVKFYYSSPLYSSPISSESAAAEMNKHVWSVSYDCIGTHLTYTE